MNLWRSFLLSLCVPVLALAADGDKLRVSSFSTILTEIAEQVGGDQAEVFAHVKPGVDPHEFEPRPADLTRVAEAHLVLLSAKHMEGYVAKLKQNAPAGKVIEVGDGFPSLKSAGGHDHDHDHGHSHGDEDPHWWQSIENMKRATKIVRDAMTAARPAAKAAFATNADAYQQKLGALQKWVKSEIAKLPRNQRKLVTSHDAFQYFAKENGFTIHPIEGITPAEQPSSKKVAGLIKLIKEQRVKAIFSESLQNPKVLTEITRETGAALGGKLYADGLGEGDAATYDGMIRHNVTTIVNALK